MARTSWFALTGDSIGLIADKLGITHVLEGSVRRDGDDLRVTAQLIDAQSEAHLWSRTYDREFGDILDLQSEIARDVGRSLELELKLENDRVHVDPAADERFVQARFFYLRRAGDEASEWSGQGKPMEFSWSA